MSKIDFWKNGALFSGAFVLALVIFNSPFAGRYFLSADSGGQKNETAAAANPATTIPYRNYISFQIPAGSTEAVGVIPDIPFGKILTIEFASIRVGLPSANQGVIAGINTGSGFNAFVMSEQGNTGGYQHFVATQQMNLVYGIPVAGSGIYVARTNPTGAATINVYVVGQLEQ